MFNIAFHNGCVAQIAGQVAIYCNETEDEVLCLGTETSEPSALTLLFPYVFFTTVARCLISMISFDIRGKKR